MSEKTNNCFGLEKKRYQTKEIDNTMPIEYRLLMWQWIDDLVQEKGNADYLQVFNFSIVTENGISYQLIEHTQEVPAHSETYRLNVSGKGITGKVFVIDDGEQCTMLWADEY